jgi:DNA-binding NarL/FixJ family response regulator
VVDDQRHFRRAAVALVRSVPRFELLGEAESGEQAVVLATELRPDFVVMDVRLPGIGGQTATSQILADQPGVRVLLVSTYELADLPAELVGCGAAGFERKQDLDAECLLRWAEQDCAQTN